MFGRKLRTSIPVHPTQLIPKWPDFELVRQRDEKDQALQKADFDKRHRTKELPKLRPGDEVFIQGPDDNSSGVVQEEHTTPRSYIIETPSGRIRRNRRALVPIPDTIVNQNHTSEKRDHEECRRSTRKRKPPDRLNL